MAKARLPFLRLIKGRYWYFRTKKTGDIRVPGNPGEASFWQAYGELLRDREAGRLTKNSGRRRAHPLVEDIFVGANSSGPHGRYITKEEAREIEEVERRFFEKRAMKKAAACKDSRATHGKRSDGRRFESLGKPRKSG